MFGKESVIDGIQRELTATSDRSVSTFQRQQTR